MKKKYILTIDQGTTSTRAILYNKKLEPINSYQIEIRQYYPHEGWVEHNPEEIWRSVKLVSKKVLHISKIKSTEILSIGITNQRETSVMWNRETGKPVYNAIVWQDRRTIKYCDKIRNKKIEKKIQKISGLILDPYFSATKISWILQNIRNARNLANKNKIIFGTIDTWLLWKLTNGKAHLTDFTNASRTMLFDINKKIWSKELLKFFNIPKNILPKVVDNTFNFGSTYFLGDKINITGIAGDQQAALIGQSCFKRGMSKSTYGTGCFFMMNIGKKIKLSKNKLLTTIAYSIDGRTSYCLEGSIYIAGAAVQWLRDGIKIINSANITSELYKKADEEQNIYMVPAFTGMGAPYWNSQVRGAIYGLNLNTGIPEIVKATIRSICFQTKDLVKLLEEDSGIKINQIKIDGGMVKNESFIKFLSDILNIKIYVPKFSETTSLGVAYLAGIQVGLFKNLSEINRKWKLKKIYIPKMNNTERGILYKKWSNALKKTLLHLD